MMHVVIWDARPWMRRARRGVRVALWAGSLAVGGSPAAAAATSAAQVADSIDSLMRVVDILQRVGKYIAIGSMMFSGVLWMGGHRTEATERAVGTAIGYLILNHAVDIIELLEEL